MLRHVYSTGKEISAGESMKSAQIQVTAIASRSSLAAQYAWGTYHREDLPKNENRQFTGTSQIIRKNYMVAE